MKNFLNLNMKPVLLTYNKSRTSRTKYSLFAVKYNEKFIILNLNLISVFLQNFILHQNLYPELNIKEVSIEKKIRGYKSDVFIVHEEGTILVEAKGVISTASKVCFPNVYSERSIKQLLEIKQMLKEGINVDYIFVNLSPFLKKITFTSDTKYLELLRECQKLGMRLRVLEACYNHDTQKVLISKRSEDDLYASNFFIV